MMHMGGKILTGMAGLAALAGLMMTAPAALAADWTGMPMVAYPKDNAYSPAKAELGKKLFFEPRLSGSNIMSCATCHNPALGWADGLKLGKGHNMGQLGRHTPTVINSAFSSAQFWDGRAATLEDQAKGPIVSAGEMNQDATELVTELSAIPGYVAAFAQVFPGEAISLDTIAKAIATYEREVVSDNSAFDTFMRGDATAISDSARRGWDLFRGKAQCLSCHSGPNFSDGRFHDIGVNDGDPGRGKVSGKSGDQFKFKTPTVRDVTRTAPFLHNGQEATLLDVVKFYNRGGDRKGSEIKALGLSDADMADLVAFMKSLTGRPVLVTLPELP
ncbi:MAG: hypothetical protein OEW11_00325 [Nitrospirota bacterium]|nr:hypothetical protein [Nitrospirota bacterium]